MLKQYVYQLDLNTVWTGGISSYSLILMLVCFFQVKSRFSIRKKKKDFQMFFSFFKTYYRKDSHLLTSPLVSLGLSRSSSSTIKSSTSIKITSQHAQATDDCSSSISYPSSSAASCVSSDDHINCSNPSSDNDDDQSNSNRFYHPSNNWIEQVNLGHMLLSFLQLYGVYFDYAKLGIRVTKPNQLESAAGFVDKEELFKTFCCGHRATTNLCIVDPFNESKDLSSCLFIDFVFYFRRK